MLGRSASKCESAAAFLLLGLGWCACANDGASLRQESPTWTVDSIPTLVLGLDDQRPGHDLYRVMAASRLADGEIVVADAGSSELRFFEPEGELQRTAGGAGEGPEEFRLIAEMARTPGDTMIVLSFPPALSWIGPDAAFLRRVRLDPLDWRLPCLLAEGGITPMPSGRLLLRYDVNHGVPGCPALQEGITRHDGLAAVFDPETTTLDTLIELPATERNGPNYRVYGRLLLAAAGDERVFVGETGSESIHVFRGDRSDPTVMPVPFVARQVPAAARTETVRQFRRPDGSTARGEDYDYAGTYPRFGRLLVDRVGLLWVMAYPPLDAPISSWTLTSPEYFPRVPGGFEWVVLDAEGQVRASVHTPGDLFPLEIGDDYMLAVLRDDMDVQTVALFSLDRRSDH